MEKLVGILDEGEIDDAVSGIQQIEDNPLRKQKIVQAFVNKFAIPR